MGVSSNVRGQSWGAEDSALASEAGAGRPQDLRLARGSAPAFSALLWAQWECLRNPCFLPAIQKTERFYLTVFVLDIKSDDFEIFGFVKK